jgi:protein TonB
MLDRSVKAPVEIARDMPPFTPPRELAWRSFRGVIEVVVGVDGRVRQARMLERIAPFYDSVLVEAASQWRFRPALRDGVPVPFRHQIQIILRPPT